MVDLNVASTPKEGEKYLEDACTMVIEVGEFSNSNVSTSSRSSDQVLCVKTCNIVVAGLSPFFETVGDVAVYPDGCDSSTEGHVYLGLRIFRNSEIAEIEVTCVAAIVDAEGYRRFPQSFAFRGDALHPWENHSVEKYVSRDLLLTAADELLPDDTLTVQVDVHVIARVCLDRKDREKQIPVYVALVQSVDHKTEMGGDGRSTKRRHYLSLDSPVAEFLRGKSRYFERLSVVPMTEKDSGHVEIPDQQYETFVRMVDFLWTLYDEQSFTLREILDIYALADYYGIDSVLDTCRLWLKLVCPTIEDTSAISSFADFYEDEFLKKIVRKENKTQVREADLPTSDPSEMNEEWTYTPISNKMILHPGRFVFRRRKKMKEKEGSGHVTEDISDISNCYI